MSRRITPALICTTLTVVIVLAIVVMSAKGQTTAPTVKGFPFVQVGRAYEISAIPIFRITKDLGNGWVETQWVSPQLQDIRPVLVNLNQVTVLTPQ